MGARSNNAPVPACCATPEQFLQELRALKPEEIAKLMLIATYFWSRRIKPVAGTSIMPEDLFQEAIARTLAGERKWPTHVSILKYLDRTMESISGKLAHSEARNHPPDGSEPTRKARASSDSSRTEASDTMDGASHGEDQELLSAYFENSPKAAQVLRLKSEHYSAAEIRTTLGLSETEYSTILRNIRRTMIRVSGRVSS